MKPGLYRNVSSIFIQLSEKFNKYNLLLDCGEGSYQQLHNYYGEKKTNEILNKTKIIFLSHKHGDHMLGILKVIFEIDKVKLEKNNISFEEDKVYIVAPKTLTKWIKKNIQNDYNIINKDLFIFIDNSQINPNIFPVYSKFAIQDNPYTGFCDVELELSEEFLSKKIFNYFEYINKNSKEENEEKIDGDKNYIFYNIDNYSSDNDSQYHETSCNNTDSYKKDNVKNQNISNSSLTNKQKIFFSKSECQKIIEFYKYIQKNLGINFFSIEVFHCDESFGCFFEHFEDFSNEKRRNWKISYSGDTRPCNNFNNFAAFSSLFIHEATFDDELAKDAKDKMHSTIEESIRLGKNNSSWRIALTHFSPRYIKLMPFKSIYMDDKVVFANDYFSLKLSKFYDAYKTGKRIAKLLEAASEKQIL